MKAVLWIFVLIIAPFVIAKVDQWRKRGIGDTWAWWKSENMPYELRSATLFLSEQDISTTQPVPMHGRVDQVYKAKNGVLIPLDTKLRQVNHIYESDIIQLSVYRVILSHKYKAPVAKAMSEPLLRQRTGIESVTSRQTFSAKKKWSSCGTAINPSVLVR